MIGVKRFIRPAFLASVLGHGGLLLGLLYVGANGVRRPPPEAMAVEIVPASELSQNDTDKVEGTPLELTSSGSEVSSDSEKGSASEAPPRPKSALPSLQQAQTPTKQERSTSSAASQAQAAAPDEPETQPLASEPLLRPTATMVQPEPQPKKDKAQPNAGEMFAMPLALPGGQLGGGFDAPASKPAMLPHDDTAAFRAHLSSCSHLPPGVDRNASILLRLSFKRDGTLAESPELLDSSLSPDAATLLHSAVTALERCQPFTELSAEKYKTWKVMRLVVTPLALSGE